MTKTLILGPIPTDFSLENQHPVAAHCFLGEEAKMNGHTFPEITWDKQTHRDMALNILHDIITKKTNELNQRLSATHSITYWWPILAPQLIDLIQMTLIAILNIKAQIDAKIPLNAYTSAKLNGEWRFVDKKDFYKRGVCNNDFLFWLHTQVAKKILPKTLTPIDIPIETTIPNKKELVTDYRYRRCLGVGGLSDVQEHLLSFILSTKSCLSTQDYTPPTIPKPTITPSTFLTEWQQLAEDIYEKVLPQSITNNLSHFYKKSQKITTKQGAVRVIGGGVMDNELCRFKLGKSIESGERVYFTQHGGCYGTDSIHISSQALETVVTNFISWGWTHNLPNGLSPLALPSPYLSKLNPHNKANKAKILFVENKMTPSGISALNEWPSANEWLTYRDHRRQFIAALPEDLQESVHYRPYPRTSFTLEGESVMQQHFPKLKMDKGKMEESLKTTSVLVLDYPATTFNIAFATNIPLVMYLTNWQFSKEADPFITQMKALNIIHDTPQKAAEFLANTNINDWWYSTDVQALVTAYRNNFCQSSPTYFKEWIRALVRL